MFGVSKRLQTISLYPLHFCDGDEVAGKDRGAYCVRRSEARGTSRQRHFARTC